MIQEQTMKSVIGQNVQSLLRSNHIDYMDLASYIGRSESATRNWSKGVSIPNWDFLIDLCDAFDVTIGFILGTNNFPIKYGLEKPTLKEIGATFTDNVRDQLAKNKYTHAYFAEEKIYVDVVGFNEMLRSRRLPKTSRIIEICEAFDVDPNYMCGYSSIPKSIVGSQLWVAEYGE